MAKPVFVTTSIPYINAEPHIGHLFEFVATDVLARAYRLAGHEVFFLTGTDEHGQKVAEAAKKAGLPEQEYADQLAEKFQQVLKDFHISNDYFIRTTDPKHKEFAQKQWQKLVEKGDLEKRSYTGLYCPGCEEFKTDKELKDGKCLIHDRVVEKIEEENWFFKLTNYQQPILAWLNQGAVKPEGRANEIIKVVENLEDISVSRPISKLTWGIPVPNDETQVMYVWTDALLNYISALEITGKTNLWPADFQVIGKDILRFHAAIWPGLLLALGYELPKQILVHGFINVDGQKMSKSLGNVIAPKELLERYGAEATRYLLLRQLSFYDDSNFVWGEFDALYNGELANGLGNLVARVIGLAKKANVDLPQSPQGDSPDQPTFLTGDYQTELEKTNQLLNQADRLITEQKLWEGLTPDSEKATHLQTAANLVLQAANKLEPVLPETVQRIRQQFSTLQAEPLFPRLVK